MLFGVPRLQRAEGLPHETFHRRAHILHQTLILGVEWAATLLVEPLHNREWRHRLALVEDIDPEYGHGKDVVRLRRRGADQSLGWARRPL